MRRMRCMTTAGTLCVVFPANMYASWVGVTQVLRHDIGDKQKVGTISEAYPHLIFDKFTSKLGQRIQNILKFLFPVPKDDNKRVISFVNLNDYISFRHHVYEQPKVRHSASPAECASSSAASRCAHPFNASGVTCHSEGLVTSIPTVYSTPCFAPLDGVMLGRWMMLGGQDSYADGVRPAL